MADLTPRTADLLINAYLASEEPRLARKLLAVFEELGGALTASAVDRMVQVGAADPEILEALTLAWGDLVDRFILPGWRTTIETSATTLPEGVWQLLQAAKINEWLGERRDFVLSGFTRQSQEGLQALISHFAAAEPIGSSTLARLLRPALPLDSQQVGTITRQIDAMRADGVTGDQLVLSASRMAQRMQASRAQKIARTELAAAYNGGVQLAVEQGRAEGLLDEVTKVWKTQRDERVCDICGPLDGETAPLDGDFGDIGLIPPAHPLCRCVVLYQEAGL